MLSEEDLQKIREIIEDVTNKSDNIKKIKICKIIEETEKWCNERETNKDELQQKADMIGLVNFIVEERDKLRETIRKLKIVM